VNQLKLSEGVPTCFRKSRLEVAGVSLGASLDSHSGGSCGELALLEVCFCWCCKFGLNVRTCGTSVTDSGGMSRESSSVLCPWLKLLPPWKGS
jgi:hypothetical protein